jgi:hypothetical protein
MPEAEKAGEYMGVCRRWQQLQCLVWYAVGPGRLTGGKATTGVVVHSACKFTGQGNVRRAPRLKKEGV